MVNSTRCTEFGLLTPPKFEHRAPAAGEKIHSAFIGSNKKKTTNKITPFRHVSFTHLPPKWQNNHRIHFTADARDANCVCAVPPRYSTVTVQLLGLWPDFEMRDNLIPVVTRTAANHCAFPPHTFLPSETQWNARNSSATFGSIRTDWLHENRKYPEKTRARSISEVMKAEWSTEYSHLLLSACRYYPPIHRCIIFDFYAEFLIYRHSTPPTTAGWAGVVSFFYQLVFSEWEKKTSCNSIITARYLRCVLHIRRAEKWSAL